MLQSPCPDRETLHGHRLGTLPDNLDVAVQAHLSDGCPTCAQVLRELDQQDDEMLSLMQLYPGLPTAPNSTGRRFDIRRPHAKGGQGEVFVAFDNELRREVALKQIQERFADHPEVRARFLREAEITGCLEHPGIVPVYSLGKDDCGQPFYAMRLIGGKSLMARIEQNHRLSDPALFARQLRLLVRRFIDVCNTVSYAHWRGVVHRDLKPDNIMLGEFGETLIVDWGLAKVMEPDLGSVARGDKNLLTSTSDLGEATSAGKVVGTPAYMSPEQASGRSDLVGTASDVYSLGATLYCLLTGRPPFIDKDVAMVLEKVQCGEFPRPREVNSAIPLALEAICLKAMSLRLEERYWGAFALAREVENWMDDLPVAALPEPIILKGHTRRVGAVLFSGSNDALYSASHDGTVRAWRTVALDDPHIVTLKNFPDEQDYMPDLAFSPDAKWLAVACFDGTLRLWWGAKALPPLVLQAHTDGLTVVRFSHDGRWLGSASRDKTVLLWDLGAFDQISREIEEAASQGSDRTYQLPKQQSPLVAKHEDAVIGLAFGRDGARLATLTLNGVFRIFELSNGRTEIVRQGKCFGVGALRLSPDGKILALSHIDQNRIALWDIGTAQEMALLKGHSGSVMAMEFSPDGMTFATASHDSTVRLWDVKTGATTLVLRGHSERVTDLAFSNDGTKLATASADTAVRVWRLPSAPTS